MDKIDYLQNFPTISAKAFPIFCSSLKKNFSFSCRSSNFRKIPFWENFCKITKMAAGKLFAIKVY